MVIPAKLFFSHGCVASDSVQKIFPVKDKNLAYTVSGTAVITRGDSDEVVFDFVEETRKAFESLPSDLSSIRQFADALGSTLYCSLTLSHQRAYGSAFCEMSTWYECLFDFPTTITLDGYYDCDIAVQGEVKFD
jgi:hypothetical protein